MLRSDILLGHVVGDVDVVAGHFLFAEEAGRVGAAELSVHVLVGEVSLTLDLVVLAIGARDLGLPVEALNSAADFFVHRIPDWRRQIEPFRTGKSGRVFRPSPTLFLILKLRRLSTRDLDDCLELLRRCRRDALVVDTRRVHAELATLAPADEAALSGRRRRLSAALEAD
jgi:hypothetical protein